MSPSIPHTSLIEVTLRVPSLMRAVCTTRSSAEAIWSRFERAPCYKRLAAEDRQWVQLFRAVGARDSPAMARNAGGAADFFNIPPNRVVELGTRICL